MLQCVVVCHSALQCVEVRCSVMQCNAVPCSEAKDLGGHELRSAQQTAQGIGAAASYVGEFLAAVEVGQFDDATFCH